MLDRLTVVGAALGNERVDGGWANVLVRKDNMGGGMVQDRGQEQQQVNAHTERVKTINLWTLLEEIAGMNETASYPAMSSYSCMHTDKMMAKYSELGSSVEMVVVVVKLDIEGSICRALTAQGSERVFSSVRQDGVKSRHDEVNNNNFERPT